MKSRRKPMAYLESRGNFWARNMSCECRRINFKIVPYFPWGWPDFPEKSSRMTLLHETNITADTKWPRKYQGPKWPKTPTERKKNPRAAAQVEIFNENHNSDE